MLVLLRKKAGVIAAIVVTAMVLTLFAGTLFLGSSQNTTAHVNPEDVIATVGDTIVTTEKYNEILNQFIIRYQLNSAQKQDPEFLELVQYTAFEQALQTAIILEAANAADVKVRSADLDAAMQGVLVQYDLKDESQLKQKLKEANYPWDKFEENLENDVKIQLFSAYLQRNVKVTNQDVNNHYVQARVQQILIRVAPGDKEAEETAKKKADDLFAQLQKGADFSTLAKDHSQDLQSKDKGGDLGWIQYGSTVPEFETAMYALDTGEISRPIRTPFGFQIIKVIEKKATPRPVAVNYEAEKTQLLQLKQQNAVANYIRGVVSQGKLDIRNPYIRAYYAKVTGDDKGALDAYQAQESLNSYDPRPHYFAAKIYSAQKNTDAALTELKRAVLKGELSQSGDIPIAHVELGKAYGKQGNIASQNAEFDKAMASAKGHLMVMKTIEKALKEAGDARRSGLVATEVMHIEAMIKQNQAAQNPSAKDAAQSSTLKL
ncbi:hypothetical protein EBR57_00995 [bacterium]|nr:hypothetical protein [bacterium]